MAELREILELWRTARAQGEDLCLATVVRVEGSAYRKPGARMLLTSGGRRAGTISGGCLEGEVQKKAWWLTEAGPTVQQYSTFFDEDSEMPYGLGCGGTVLLLLERGEAVDRTLSALEYGAQNRCEIAIVTSIDANLAGGAGVRLIVTDDGDILSGEADGTRRQLAQEAIRNRRPLWRDGDGPLFVEYAPPPQALYVLGAGDDAQPLVEFARRLGWVVTVADGRSHLTRTERFPLADTVVVSRNFQELVLRERDAVVILTHSYEQDLAALRAMLPRELGYLGILGPRARTARLISEVAPELGFNPDECLLRLHSPVGLNIGAKDPAAIALSIVAEIHAVLEHGVIHRKHAISTNA